MNNKTLTFLSFVFVSWGSLSQACPCVDKQTLAINQTYHQASLQVEQSVLSRLQNPDLIALVTQSVIDDQAKLKEIDSLSYNYGIPYEYSDLSKGFTDRGTQAVNAMKNTPAGVDLDTQYITY